MIPRLDQRGVESVRLPPRSPKLNAYAEREIASRERLGGLSPYYHRKAA